MKSKWVMADSVRADAIWHRALSGDRREVDTYCGENLKLNMTNARIQDDQPSSGVCPRCSVMATRA